ncbi:hypothetical protein ABFS83_05G028700 [Erythranthe nasuta]
MLNTCVTSKFSLRRRESLPFSTNEYSYCSSERNPLPYSSSAPCCSCCSYPMYKSPLPQTYCFNLYGLRQSSLIQWSPYRKLIPGGFDRCNYSRLPFRDVDRSCYCDKVCSFRVKSLGVRKGGMVKRLVYEERSDFGGFDEAEAVLSLLTEDFDDEECFRVSKETRRFVKKPLVEKRENGGSKKKSRVVEIDDDVESERRCECGSVVRSRKKDNRREEIIRRRGEDEALLREENKEVMLREQLKIASKNRTAREKEGREALLLRKTNRKFEEKEERESTLRKENRKASSRTEEREDLLRREEQRQKVRRDGSSCSSYYSLSSTGDFDSENEIENENENSLSVRKGNLRRNEMVYRDSREEDKRHEDYREEYGAGLTKKNTEKEFYGGSSVVEYDHGKKSEKSFNDVSVEEMESRKEKSSKELNILTDRKNNNEKFSDHYVSHDDTKVRFDEERKHELRQTDDDVSRRSETRMKYKQHVETQDARSDDFRASYGSQKVYVGKNEISAKVENSSQQRVGEQKVAAGLRTNREDEYRRNSRKISEISEIQEIDVTKTSVSQQTYETSVKKEDHSSSVLSSVNNAAKLQQQYGQVSGFVESSSSQQLSKKDGKSSLKTESDKLITREERAKLAYGSSLESDERGSQRHAKIIKKDHSINESDKSTKISVTQSENSGAIYIEDTNNTKSDTPVKTSSYLPETGPLSLRSDDEIVTTDGSLQFDSNLEGSFEFHHGVSGGAGSSSSQGQPSEFVSHKDAIDSAARLEKSSARYVDQFVDHVRNEVSSSEIQREKKTSETKSVHEEITQSKDHKLSGDGQLSGAKGPTDEMWTVNEPSVQNTSKVKVQDNTSEAGNAIVKRTGRSLWNVFADIVRLRWSPHSESHSSGRKTGERSSPNQSTSSGTWFSGQEAEQYEEGTEEKEEGRSITQGSSGSYRGEKKPAESIVKEGSTSSTSNEPSPSVAPERGSQSFHGGDISDGGFTDTSSAVIIGSSVPIPALRMRRSPAVRVVSEGGEADAPDSGVSEPLNTGQVDQSEPSSVNEGELKRRKLQRKDQVVKDRFDEWEEAYTIEAEQRKIDETFMREALLEAQKAADMWEVPVGAVLVHNGEIIARGYNLVEELRDSTAHAEIICIREASNALKSWRLSETTLYVTLEPCPMCAGAILQARIDTVVWGAPNKLLGADGSWIRLFPGGGEGNSSEQSDKPAAPVHPFHPKIIIRRGVLSNECAEAMQQFFKRRRKKEKKPEIPSSSSSTTSSTPPSCLPITHHRPSKFFTKMHNAFHIFCV